MFERLMKERMQAHESQRVARFFFIFIICFPSEGDLVHVPK